MQGLAVLGWPGDIIAAEAGVTRQAVAGWRNRDRLEAGTLVEIRRLYGVFSARRGPSVIVTRRALTAGWVPPLAWDDETIDDPATVPYSAADSAVGAVDEALDLWRDGEHIERAAARAGIAVESMVTALRRHGTPLERARIRAARDEASRFRRAAAR